MWILLVVKIIIFINFNIKNILSNLIIIIYCFLILFRKNLFILFIYYEFLLFQK